MPPRYLSLSLLALLLTTLAASPSAAQEARHLALVTDLKGEVVVARASSNTPVEAQWGTQLFEGDEVKTQAGAGASILFANNHLVTLGPNSSMTIAAGPAPVVPAGEPVRRIDGPLLADVSGLTLHRTGHGELAALGGLRSAQKSEGLELLAPRNSRIMSQRPVFVWHGPASIESFQIRVLGEGGLIWKAETTGGQISYPDDAPTLVPGVEYLWQVEGEEMLESVKSPLVPFSVLSLEASEAVAAREESFRAQLIDDPDGTNLQFVLGSYYVQEGLLMQAISSFEEIAERHPQAMLPQEILGKLYAEVGLKDDAIRAFQRAIALGQR